MAPPPRDRTTQSTRARGRGPPSLGSAAARTRYTGRFAARVDPCCSHISPGPPPGLGTVPHPGGGAGARSRRKPSVGFCRMTVDEVDGYRRPAPATVALLVNRPIGPGICCDLLPATTAPRSTKAGASAIGGRRWTAGGQQAGVFATVQLIDKIDDGRRWAAWTALFLIEEKDATAEQGATPSDVVPWNGLPRGKGVSKGSGPNSRPATSKGHLGRGPATQVVEPRLVVTSLLLVTYW